MTGFGARLFAGNRHAWQQRYVLTLLALDAVLLTAVTFISGAIRFADNGTHNDIPYAAVAAGVSLLWLLGLATARCYEPKVALSRSNELLRVVKASFEVFAVVALVSYLTQAEFSRVYLLLVFPLGVVALTLARVMAHRLLRLARTNGAAQRRVLVVGDAEGVWTLSAAFATELANGHRIVAACLTSGPEDSVELGEGTTVPATASLATIADAVREHGADTVAVAAGSAVSDEVLRQLCYDLEGLGVDTLVAPSLTDVAGTRISVRPVAGLPLLHLDEPELDGPHKLIKGAFDRTSAALGILLLLPVLTTLALLVRFGSPGGVLFKQNRVGRDGELFKVWKFRSMYPDAEAKLASLMSQNVHDGPLFKIKNDPRVTPIGRVLRKWSLDELPQLFNVLKGDMSLVGPRPQLPAEVAQYAGPMHRRLLVKPGITGLWQVSGRADLDWEQTIRLDLAYVDGWSLGFDLSILARTALAVVRSSGAY